MSTNQPKNLLLVLTNPTFSSLPRHSNHTNVVDYILSDIHVVLVYLSELEVDLSPKHRYGW